MPRSLKPYKVDEVRSPNGYATADVMFDRDRKRFFVEITPGDPDSRVISDLLADVKKQAATALASAQKYEWTELIEVSVSEAWYSKDNGRHTSIRFEFRRFERSPSPTHPDRFLERAHRLDVDATEGEARSEARKEYRDITSYNGRDEVGPGTNLDATDTELLLPYRQDVWQGLCAIERVIEGARDQLEKLLVRRDVESLLSNASATSSSASSFGGVLLLTKGKRGKIPGSPRAKKGR